MKNVSLTRLNEILGRAKERISEFEDGKKTRHSPESKTDNK